MRVMVDHRPLLFGLASVYGALFLQLGNARRKLLVAQLPGLPILVRNADVTALNRLAVHRVALARKFTASRMRAGAFFRNCEKGSQNNGTQKQINGSK
jgi:hypothetical protein